MSLSPKSNATYYAKPLEAVSSAIYDVNPALYHGLSSRVGRFPIDLPDPWNNDYIHFNALRKAVKMRVGDAPGWDAVPDSLPDPGVVKGKWFWWNGEITEKQMKSLEMNPNGLIAQQIRSELIAQQDYFMAQVDLWLAGYLYANTVDDYDAEWRPLMGLSSSSTVTNPNDACAAAGTATNLTAVKQTGVATTVDAFNTSLGVAKGQFYQQYDSTTHQTMFHKTNTFDVFAHPAVIEKWQRGYLSNASGELDYSRSFYDVAAKEFTIVPTFAYDAAYDGASTTEAQVAMSLNTSENFQIAEAVPYTIEPWKYFDSDHKFHMRAFWKIFPMVKAYRIGSYWVKASQILRLTPYANT